MAQRPVGRAYWEQRDFREDRWIEIHGEHLMMNLAERPACYVVFNVTNQRPLYVGQSNKPRARFRHHFCESMKKDGSQTPWGSLENLYIKVKHPSKYGYEAMLEKRLIRRLNPRFNIRKMPSKERMIF